MLSRRRSLGAALIGVAALLAACQTAPATPGGDAVASPAHNAPGTASDSAPTVSPGEDLGRHTGVSDGRVHVTVTPTRPAPGATIQVVVANGLDRAVYTDDAKADCSIVMLQRLEGITWRDVPGCAQQRPPATVAIGPAHARTVTLHPASSNFRVLPDSRIDPGTYRARYTYRLTQTSRAPTRKPPNPNRSPLADGLHGVGRDDQDPAELPHGATVMWTCHGICGLAHGIGR